MNTIHVINTDPDLCRWNSNLPCGGEGSLTDDELSKLFAIIESERFTPHEEPLSDEQLDRLEKEAFKGLLRNRINSPMKQVVYDFAFFGADALTDMVAHLNLSLADVYSPYRLEITCTPSHKSPEQIGKVKLQIVRQAADGAEPTGKEFVFVAPKQLR